MDDAPLRRGRPANHLEFGEAIAILAAFGLLNLAYGTLARAYEPALASRMSALISDAVGPDGLIGGQALDLQATDQAISFEMLERIHRGKTGALFVAAATCGALTAGAAAEPIARARRLRQEPRPRVPDHRRPARRRRRPRPTPARRCAPTRARRRSCRSAASTARGSSPRSSARRRIARWRRSGARRIGCASCRRSSRAAARESQRDRTGADPRVDDLRQRLRSLGYLDAGRRSLPARPCARRARLRSRWRLLASLRVGAARRAAARPGGGHRRRRAAARTGQRRPRRARRSPSTWRCCSAARHRRRRARRAWPDRRAGARSRTGASLGPARASLSRSPRGVGGCAAPSSGLSRRSGGGRARRRLRRHAGVWPACGAARSRWRSACCSATRSRSRRSRSSSPAPARRCERPVIPAHPGASCVGCGVAAFCGARWLLFMTPADRRAVGDEPRRSLTVVSSGAACRAVRDRRFRSRDLRRASAAARLPALSRPSPAPRSALAGRRDSGRIARDRRASGRPSRPAQPPEVHGVRSLETRQVAGVQRHRCSGDDVRVARLPAPSTDLLRLTRPSVASRRERRRRRSGKSRTTPACARWS